MNKLMFYMLVFFGGGFGCVTRFLIDGTDLHAFTISNIVACLLLGISYALYNYCIWSDNKFFHCFVNIGFLGGLSTFTPLAMFSIASAQDNLFIATAYLLGILLAYIVLCFAGYLSCNYFLKFVLKRKRQMSMLARTRYLFQYKMLLAEFDKVKAGFEELKALNVPLHIDSALGPLVGKREELKQKAMIHLRLMLTLTERYNQSVIDDKCASYGFEQMLQDAHKKGELGDPLEPFTSIKDQLQYVNGMLDEMQGTVASHLAKQNAKHKNKNKKK